MCRLAQNSIFHSLLTITVLLFFHKIEILILNSSPPPMKQFIVFPLLTLIINVIIAFIFNHIPYFPIEMSKIANFVPEYYIFVVGMTTTALSLVFFFRNKNEDRISFVFRILTGLFLVLLAIFSDRNYLLVHFLTTTVFFVSACFYLVMNINFIKQSSLFPIILLGASVGVITSSIAYHILVCPIHSLFLLRCKAIAQYIAIATLGYCFSKLHTPPSLANNSHNLISKDTERRDIY